MNPAAMNTLYLLFASIAAGGALFFLLNWLMVTRRLRTMTYVERTTAEVEEGRRLQDKKKPAVRFNEYLASLGYRGEVTAVVVGGGLLYLGVIVGLYAAGITGFIAPLVAFPLTVLTAFMITVAVGSRRRRVFNYQLKQLFDLLAGQLEAGFGTFRAMEMIVPNLPDPLRTEFDKALRAARADRDLIGHLTEVADLYPSKAFDLFLAALEIDDIQGGSLANTLTKASDMLEREFRLARAAQTKLASSKQTFYVVLGVVGFMMFAQLVNSDQETANAYRSFVGVAGLTIALGNATIGVIRVLRTFRSARGDF